MLSLHSDRRRPPAPALPGRRSRCSATGRGRSSFRSWSDGGRLVVIADSEFASNRQSGPLRERRVPRQRAGPRRPARRDRSVRRVPPRGRQRRRWRQPLGRAWADPLQLALIQAPARAGRPRGRWSRSVSGRRSRSGGATTRTSAEYVSPRSPACTSAPRRRPRRWRSCTVSSCATSPPDSPSRPMSTWNIWPTWPRGGAGSRRTSLRRLLATCEQRLDEGRVTEPELLDLARRMERIRKDIGIA